MCRLAVAGIPADQKVRAVAWQLLLGYLPPRRSEWKDTLQQRHSGLPLPAMCLQNDNLEITMRRRSAEPHGICWCSLYAWDLPVQLHDLAFVFRLVVDLLRVVRAFSGSVEHGRPGYFPDKFACVRLSSSQWGRWHCSNGV